MPARIIFITGTDTGAGKTVVAGLLTAHLQTLPSRSVALKPFCSGERTDALLLRDLQQGRISLEEVNPCFFSLPVSPWTAARQAGRSIARMESVAHISKHARNCAWVLIEGAGGLLAPLGEDFNAADLIVDLGAEVIVVAANRLGVLNHTLLTVEALQRRQVRKIKVALVDMNSGDLACNTNEDDLRLLRRDLEIHRIPFLNGFVPSARFLQEAARSCQCLLEGLLK